MWLITYMQNRGATADAWVSRSIMAAAAARQEVRYTCQNVLQVPSTCKWLFFLRTCLYE